MDALTEVLQAIKQLDLPLQCYFHPCIQHKLMHIQQLFTVCVCTVRITVSLCFSRRVNRLHEIEHFSCWFTMKWCACVGLRCVSFSKSNGGVTEREKAGEESGPLTATSAAPVYYTVRALCNLDKLFSEDRHLWKHKYTASTHKHWITSAWSLTESECVRCGSTGRKKDLKAK